MGEILGLGVTHYPPLCMKDGEMSGLLQWTLNVPDIPAAEKVPENWPELMRREWSDDRGTAAAARHRATLCAGFTRVRAALDDFAPDVVVVWGDDQYENFREDVIPPFTVCAYDDMELRPWAHAQDSSAMLNKPNVWEEGTDTVFTMRGRPDIARALATGLLETGIDVAYAYKPLHHESLAHAFLNTILFLDYDRRGFDHPVIPFPLNCYGRRVVSCKGFITRLGEEVEFDPPSPPPGRFMTVGAAAARYFRESPWRVALVASSSWSHAFLCDKTYRLRPDTESDRVLYQALRESDYDAWRSTGLEAIEAAGEQEVLNWFALLGAMEELGAPLEWSDWVETDVFNSNKAFAIYGQV